MTEVATPRWERVKSLRPIRALGIGAVGIAFGASIGAIHFDKSEVRTEIAATDVTISPNYASEFYTFENGLLPDIRIESGHSFGLDIDVGNTSIPSGGMASDNGKRLIAAYAAVAAQPDAEVEKVANLMQRQALESAGIGLIAGLTPLVIYGLIGSRRRNELYHKKYLMAGTGIAAMAVASVGTVITEAAPSQPDTRWTSIQSVFPGASTIPELSSIQIRDSAVVGVAENLTEGIVQKYEESKVFYDALEQRVLESPDLFHTPEEGQTVAILMSDRHDNIGIDPVLRATGDMAGASILINAGDDTSAGQRWETFSLRSLINNFKGYETIVVGGNHDNDGYTNGYFKQAGATVPEGLLQDIGGVPAVLANDPRRSDYTPERAEGETTFEQAEEQITTLACESDVRPGIVVVHDVNMASDILDEGCADLVVGGHTHRYAPPELAIGVNGMRGYSVTNGTSGGAAYSIALGTKLNKEASATLITFENDRPVGIQHVGYLTSGEVEVGQYEPLLLSEEDDLDAQPTTSVGPVQQDTRQN